jgi:hypothetical protein
MKSLRFSLFALVGLALAGSLRAAPATTDSASAQVEVNYVNPDKFMDIKDAYMPTDKGQAAILDDLKTYLVERTSRRLAPGQHLTINVTDIDLAGQFEPWHGPDAQDIRFIKDIYPPRMNLNFKLTDADGKVLKEGERRLSDNTYTMNINTVGRSDPRFYDKQLIDDWVRREFPAQKKKR